uniref:Sensory/regulatory protein RpfC n=1 Tax=Magnetococcus massalia (strain MO-1) TaxID=451514 RepID=A0A1S7LLW4_MAGMO|nr:Putative histidine kinase with PAS domain, HisKA domain, HATPase c domain and response regulator receiver domain [Candidatus Magnetococcus massalia]
MQSQAAATKRVLFLNSYHAGYFWSDNITKGIQAHFKDRHEVELITQYMDTKRYASADHYAQLAKLYSSKYGQTAIDLVITSDDNAFNFFKTHRRQIAPQAPWVFCGLDKVTAERLQGLEQVYGVEEDLGMNDTLDLLLTIHPQTKQIVVVADQTTSGRSYIAKTQELAKTLPSDITVKILTNKSVDEMKQALASLPSHSVVIYMSFIRDRLGQLLSLEQSHRMVAKHASVPVYVTWGFRPGLGITGGDITSGFKQGEVASQVAQRLLDQDDLASLPQLQKAPHVTLFDYAALKRFKIDPRMLPKQALIFNRPETFWTLFPIATNVATVAIVLLMVALLILITYVRRLRAARHKLEESERYNRMLFEKSPIGLALCKMDGELVDINLAYADIIGRSIAETKELTYWDITPKDYAEQEGTQLQSLEDRGAYGPYEKEYIHKSGARVPVCLTGQIITLGGEKYIWSSVEDNSIRHQAEMLRKQHQSELEAKVQERTEELSRAKDIAQKADQAKSEFLAAMSHEIRTPMNTILGMAELMAESDLPIAQREHLQVLRLAGDSLLALINNILDLSKIEANQLVLEYTPTHLPTVLEEVVCMLTPQAERKGLQITQHIDDHLYQPIKGDTQRIKQILINLLNNAIKFTEQGHIHLQVRLKGPERIEIRVEDSGIGIASDHLNSIFKPFKQGDSSITRRYGGTGLGLAICQQLVSAKGGRLWATSLLGKGSTFYCELPLKFSEVPAVPPQARVSPHGGEETLSRSPEQHMQSHKHILLVDDSEDNLRLIKAFLAKAPYQVDTADEGAQAIALFTAAHYDLVLMDIQMPVMDGITATRKIRQWEAEHRPAEPPTPIVALTAHAMLEDSTRSLEAGCNLHVTKPIRKAHLLSLMHDLLS